MFEDSRDDYGEQRMIAVGLLEALVVLVVHVENDDVIHIISFPELTNKADIHATNLYDQNVGTF